VFGDVIICFSVSKSSKDFPFFIKEIPRQELVKQEYITHGIDGILFQNNEELGSFLAVSGRSVTA